MPGPGGKPHLQESFSEYRSLFLLSLSLPFLQSPLKYVCAAPTLLFKNIMTIFLFSALCIPLFPVLITAVSYLPFIDLFILNLSLCYKVVRIEKEKADV